MRKTALALTINLFCLLAGGGEARGQTSAQPRRPAVARDVKLEAAIALRYDGIMKLLRPEARMKLAAVSHALLREVVKSPGPADLGKAARAQVKKRFVRLSAAQLDLLSFCALADVARYGAKLTDGGGTKANLESHVERMKNDLDSMSEMGEMESLRLQMAMDRLSKMMSTLSNILKKISDTSQGITQNIK